MFPRRHYGTDRLDVTVQPVELGGYAFIAVYRQQYMASVLICSSSLAVFEFYQDLFANIWRSARFDYDIPAFIPSGISRIL